ncbi:MAG TPA: GspH/FimT family pseudopilin [Longimicrobium sp.]|jgi:type IV fimbrial biogenesis protein FimT|uniref:GspH/FimT family pseudopilin n=1 Tax=Longimicrobium sp. TaxID=2029185 RepID=UPI002EDA3317
MTCAPPIRRTGRSGFSLIELLIVLVIATLIMLLAVPRMASFTRYLTSRSAASQVVADLALARTTAVREGRSASLRILTAAQYQVTIDADNAGTVASVVKTVAIDGSQRGVALATVGTRVTFDSRGMRRNNVQTIVVGRTDGGVDSINVTGVGRVYRGN